LNHKIFAFTTAKSRGKNENKFPVEWSDLAMPSWVSATVKAVSSLALLLMSRIWSTSNNPDISSILKTLVFEISNKRSTGTVANLLLKMQLYEKHLKTTLKDFDASS
jgi:hypothetical protein